MSHTTWYFTRVPFWAVDDLATETGNDRTERLRLQALYGGGPGVVPIIYAPDTNCDYSRTKLQLGKTAPLNIGTAAVPVNVCPYRDIARLALASTVLIAPML